MSEETEFRYYDASTMPGVVGRSSAVVRRTSFSEIGSVSVSVTPGPGPGPGPAALSGVAVKVAAGAGDKCVGAARSRPKRRGTICNNEVDDTLEVRSVEWTSAALSVSQLATTYHDQCPLLAKVADDCADFERGQVTYYNYRRIFHSLTRHTCAHPYTLLSRYDWCMHMTVV